MTEIFSEGPLEITSTVPLTFLKFAPKIYYLPGFSDEINEMISEEDGRG